MDEIENLKKEISMLKQEIETLKQEVITLKVNLAKMKGEYSVFIKLIIPILQIIMIVITALR